MTALTRYANPNVVRSLSKLYWECCAKKKRARTKASAQSYQHTMDLVAGAMREISKLEAHITFMAAHIDELGKIHATEPA